MLLPLDRVGGGAGHHDLDLAPVVVIVVPLGAEAHKLAVKIDAYAPAHADDHGLAVENFEALVEVVNDVLGDLPDPFLGADYGFQLGPPGLELLAALDFLALGDLLELRVDGRFLGVVQGQLGEPALVVDRHGGPVVDGAPDVVDTDVVAEDGAGIGVLELDGSAGEANERGAGQGVAHVAGVPVDEIVLAAVGLVGDDNDVTAFG